MGLGRDVGRCNTRFPNCSNSSAAPFLDKASRSRRTGALNHESPRHLEPWTVNPSETVNQQRDDNHGIHKPVDLAIALVKGRRKAATR